MKTCPYCREAIHDEAIKCKFCCSALDARPPDAAGANVPLHVRPDQVLYVLDRDLVRFAKFATAVLAVFVTVGVFLWGFDIKNTAKVVHDSADDAKKSQGEISKAKEDVDQAKSTVHQKVDEADYVLKQAKEFLTSTQQQATLLFTSPLVRAVAERGSAAGPATPTQSRGFQVPDLAKLYNFPAKLDGKGQCIGLIELGGGYNDSDLDTYFKHLNLARPKISSVSVDGSKNSRGTGADEQVMLDIEVAGAAAPAADIVIYFAPNTNTGFVDAVNRAIHDQENRPSVLSISWGQPEVSWPKQALIQLDQELQSAAGLGITVVVASGDNGASDGVDDGENHVDFPASSPWVLACGGTRLIASQGKITSETAWEGTGGGVSEIFLQPSWQSQVKVPTRKDGKTGRGVPDVAACADPTSGYLVLINRTTIEVGGTAAATPLWAGLIALINQGIGHNVGYINPVLYNKLGPAGVLNPITQGSNGPKGKGGYSAGPGWNPCTGWGSPDGTKLLDALRGIPSTQK